MPETPLLGKVGVIAGVSSRKQPPELRERAVRMVVEISNQHDSDWEAVSKVARLLGVGCAETVRKSVRQGQIDGGVRGGQDSDELKRLRRENAGNRGHRHRRSILLLGRQQRQSSAQPETRKLIHLQTDLVDNSDCP